MAFENINVSSLRSSINKCKGELNFEKSKEIINYISNNSVWNAKSKITLKTAFEKLTNERYGNLNNKLDSYSNIVSKIEEYKILQEENNQLNLIYSNLKLRLYYEEEYNVELINNKGKKYTETRTRTVKDSNVQSEIIRNRQKYNENIIKMSTIENEVSNLI